MAKKKKKKGLRLFYPIYFLLMAAAVAAIFVVRQEVTVRMAAYEASLPKYVAEEVAQMFLERDFEKVYSYQDPADFAGESAQAYAAYMTMLTEGNELTWGESYSSSEDEMVYAVRLDGKRLFEFTLVRGTLTDASGNAQWELTDVRTLGVTTATRTLRAPTSSTVYLNDQALGEESIIERDIALESETYLLNDEAKSPAMCVYQYEVCFSEPKIRVVDANGRENKLTVAADGCMEAVINSDDELKAEAEERVIEIVKAFARFTSEDLDQYKMLRLVRRDTSAYDKIERFDNDWFGKHKGNDFQNLVTENYMRFSDDTFACDIHFDYIITYDDAPDKSYETNYRFYFVERDDEWYLYDFRMDG